MDRNGRLRRAPEPYRDLVASPAFSTNWGRGWLGYRVLGASTQFWFVLDDGGAVEIEYEDIYTYDDKTRSRFWMVFRSRNETLPFLLNPPRDAVLFPLPARLRQLMEE